MQGIQVKDTAIDAAMSKPGHEVIRFREIEGREQYQVQIFLAGQRVPFVEQVTYVLHPSFTPPIQEVRRTPSNPNCALVIWTWGIFEVRAVVQEKSGEKTELVHTLAYDKEFRRTTVRFQKIE